jgi:hypothetical protein
VDEIDFVRDSLSKGAYPETVGRLVRRYGSAAAIENIVDRTLLHLLELQEVAGSIGELSLLEIETTPGSWTESIQDIFATMKLDAALSMSDTYSKYAWLSLVSISNHRWLHIVGTSSFA